MDWLKKSDITETRFQILLVNNTTETSVPADQPVEVIEVSKKTLTLSVPARCCAVGHFLSVKFMVSEKLLWGIPGKSNGFEVKVTARVDEETALDKTSKTVRLTLFQFGVEEWAALIKEVRKRQTKINGIVTGIRE
jgi:hypothetical protein